ncbi:hypothetical protein J6590_066021 [Homalodisca vitripennis]|nr:hypothetical protein J6590_066021 [Homalodisca vitripennis]
MWKKLRNNHRDALRRQKRMMKSGAAATDIKPWRFQAQMEFLLQYMVNENRETSFTNDDPNSEPQLRGQPETQQAEENQDVENNITGIVDEESQPDTADVERVNSVDLSVKEPTDNLSPPPSRPQKKFKKHEVDTVIVKAIEQREQRATERAKERKKLDKKIAPSDDLHLFFMSMYELTKKMPPSSQHIVRRNVFLSVTDEEARLLNIQQPTHSPQQPRHQVHQPMYEDRQLTYDNWSRSPNVLSPETSTSSSALGHRSTSTSPYAPENPSKLCDADFSPLLPCAVLRCPGRATCGNMRPGSET